MLIGIHAKSVFKYDRTGVEEYAYQIIKHFTMLDEAKKHTFLLYTPRFSKSGLFLPDNFLVKKMYSPFFWTNGMFSLKMLVNSPDVLFMPTNFLPAFYPKKNVVTIHGLEFEHFPEAYPEDILRYLKSNTKKVVSSAEKIIAVCQATKNDLIKFYNADPRKITVVHHGVNPQIAYHHKYPPIDESYILFVGRLEKKKNIRNIVKAFDILKDKYKAPHKLVLVGKPGFGFHNIQEEINKAAHKNDIVQTGYISHEEKESFFKFADVFVFPPFYQGFGMPVLEAQLRGVPVIASNIPSVAEVAGSGALLIDPSSVEQLAEAMRKVIFEKNIKDSLIDEGSRNVKKYSWFKCAKETLEMLTR